MTEEAVALDTTAPESSTETEEQVSAETQSEEQQTEAQRNAEYAKSRIQRQRDQARQEAKEWKDKYQTLDERLSKLENPPPPRPNREGYETQEEYEDALFEWRDSKAPKATEKPQEPTPPAAPDGWTDQVVEGREKHADFDQIALNPDLPVTESMFETISSMEEGSEVLYWLGQNPQSANRIASMPHNLQAVEMGKIQASLKATPQVSKAPEPINSKGGEDTPTVDDDKLSPEQWREKYEKRMVQRGYQPY